MKPKKFVKVWGNSGKNPRTPKNFPAPTLLVWNMTKALSPFHVLWEISQPEECETLRDVKTSSLVWPRFS